MRDEYVRRNDVGGEEYKVGGNGYRRRDEIKRKLKDKGRRMSRN